MKKKVEYWMKQVNNAPFVSVLLVCANVIIFLICTFVDTLLYNKGSISVLNLYAGEYYRMISSLFLHADSQHLVNNMLLLFGLGMMLEKKLGHVRFAVYYLLSGLGGNLLSVLIEVYQERFISSIGASGAVFGLDGVLLAWVLFSGKRINTVTLPRMILMIGYSLYSGFTAENINNAAHIGGLLTGFILTVLWCFARKKEN